MKDSGRVQYDAATDEEALSAFEWLAKREGLIAAFESAHAFALLRRQGFFEPGARVVVNMSGRGDKDMESASKLLRL